MNITIDDLLNYVKTYNPEEIEYCLTYKDVIVLTDDLVYGYRKDLIEKANTEYAKIKMMRFDKC